MVWDTGSILWEKSYAAAVQYYLENHTLEIPVKYVTPDGMALGVWLGSQRAAYKEGVLTDAQIEKLEALGVDWTNRNDRKWQTAYEAAVKYHAAHGNLDVPIEYIDEDGILLGKWVSRQRYAWQNPERSSARVTPERKALLDELGMNWEKTDSWQHATSWPWNTKRSTAVWPFRPSTGRRTASGWAAGCPVRSRCCGRAKSSPPSAARP